MKIVFKTFGIIVVVTVIGFSLAACENVFGGPPGTLTVIGDIPGHTIGVRVFNNVTGELTMMRVQSALFGTQAASTGTSSPFSLQAFGGGTFTESGRFMVVFPILGDHWFIRNVRFVNGSATIQAGDLMRISDLPTGD